MKQIFITIILVVFCYALFAQKGQVVRAANYIDSGELDKALDCIQTAIDPENKKSEKSISWSRTWQVRGELFQAIYHSKDEKTKAFSNDPLTEAFNSYKKTLELDVNNKYSESLKANLTLLVNDFQDEAINAFNNNDFKKALSSFEKVLEINGLPLIKAENPDLIDTAIIFNAGLAAQNAQDYDKAIKYYKEAADLGYNGAEIYITIAIAYKQNLDTIGALGILEQGFEKYQDNNDILGQMIQTFSDLEKREEAMKYLNIAILRIPENAHYLCAMGALYEKDEDEINAIECYNKAIVIEPNVFLANYNIGVIYFNRGVHQVEVANSIPANDNMNFQKELKKVDVWWKKSLPFMEKCHEIDPLDENTLEVMKTLYYRLNMMDKYNVVIEKLK